MPRTFRSTLAALAAAAAFSFALPIGVAEMAILPDESPIVSCGGPNGTWAGITVYWEHQGTPLVDRWDIHNGLDHDVYFNLRNQQGQLVWQELLGPGDYTRFAADIPVTINWRRSTKQNTFSFGCSG